VASPIPSPTQRVLTMFSLVLAGEAIFGLPFHVSRYFRPTYVEVFDISQTQLGILGSIYGFVAMFAYVLGGGLADRFSPRALLVFSLSITGASGIYMSTTPAFPQMCVLFGFWGLSTILPFWSALIKATRKWGEHQQQGTAFGLLDGGRGLLAAVLAMLAVYLFAQLLPDGGDSATLDEKRAGLQRVILVYTASCGFAAVFVWFFLPTLSSTEGQVVTSGIKTIQAESSNAAETATAATRIKTSSHFVEVLRMPAVWLQAIVIISAYCTFKGIDYYSQYASDILGWSDVNAARLSAFSSWMRPVAAIGAGLMADRLSASRVVIGCFLLTTVAYLSFLLPTPGASSTLLLWANVLISCLGLFALRGIYFALLEESNVPRRMTGTAVGVISFIGYTPEIFMPLLGGVLIDRWSGGVTGYHVLFAFLATMSVLGIIATLLLRRRQG